MTCKIFILEPRLPKNFFNFLNSWKKYLIQITVKIFLAKKFLKNNYDHICTKYAYWNCLRLMDFFWKKYKLGLFGPKTPQKFEKNIHFYQKCIDRKIFTIEVRKVQNKRWYLLNFLDMEMIAKKFYVEIYNFYVCRTSGSRDSHYE